MIVIPAIDILDGVCVRLYQGNYQKKEIVGKSVKEMAKYFEHIKAPYLHMVDLNGARSGAKENVKIIADCARELSIPIEVGGGIRNMEDISFYLDQGVSRVILGTAAIKDRDLLIKAIQKYQDRIAVGIDCKNGYVYTHGWEESSSYHYLDFAKEMENLHVKTIIVTDISKDGTLQGPNLEMLKKLKDKVNMDIIASGGIKTLEDIQRLKDLNIYGAITGKAIYAKTLDLSKALKITKEG